MPKIVVTVEDKLLSELPLADGELLIGRGPDCQIVIRDPLVSRHHAKIAKAYGGYFVEDLNSTNGIMVNGRRINKQMLKYGDKVQVGTHDLSFVSEDNEENNVKKTVEDEVTRIGKAPLPSPFSQPSATPLFAPTTSQERDKDKDRSGTGRPYVRYLTGPAAGASEPIEKMYTIGEPGSSLTAISKRGASYVLQRVGVGGKSSITINGEQMTGPSIPLKSGDVIQVGTSQLEFYLE